MRRGIKLAMWITTVVVVGVAMRTSVQPHSPAGAVADPPAGQPRRVPTRPDPLPPNRSGIRTPSPVQPSPTARTTSSPRLSTRPSSSATPSSPATATSVTVAGDVVQTDYGPVQIQISVRGGRITRSGALLRPSGDGQTDSINSYAIPRLDQETLAAQTATIDTVSGATFTSQGYRQSLQSALDAAHRAGAR